MQGKDETAFQRQNPQTILETRGNERFLWVPRDMMIIKSSTEVFPRLFSERGTLIPQRAGTMSRGLVGLWAFTGFAELLKGRHFLMGPPTPANPVQGPGLSSGEVGKQNMWLGCLEPKKEQ